MNLQDFHKMVSKEVRRGTSLDDLIPLWTSQSVSFLERNAPMKYMEEWINIQLEPGDQIIDFVWSFRNWKFLRRFDDAREFFYLQKRDPREQAPTNSRGTLPETYSQIGMRYIRFDTIWNGPDVLPLEGMVYKFSDWQSTRPEFRHFLLDYGSDLLLAQTMLRISAAIKDRNLAQQYLAMRDEGLKSFFSMDTDAQYEGSEDAIVYGGIYS